MDPIEDAKKFFDYSYAEIGKYDIPVNLNFVKERARGKSVTYIGFAQGATSILYALTKKEKSIYFKQLLDEVIVLAPCVYLDEPMY